MEYNNDSLIQFGKAIQRLIDKKDLSRQESYETFRQILLNLQPELHQGAFLAALVAKGETAQEIAGAWQAIVEFDTLPANETFEAPLVENCGTGMDALKTFNVSTAAAVVAAAGGVRMARHGARALTSMYGTVDLLEAVGVDVDADVNKVCQSIRKAGIGIFNGTSPKVHPRSLARILGQIRFGSTLNISASLAGPCRPTHALRGVYSSSLLPKMSEVMREIGYERGLIVHGLDATGEKGIDELSNMGESVICEFDSDGKETTYSINPEDVGLRRSSYEDVATLGNLRRESVRFMKVISGTGHDSCIDLTCLNAGAIFYLTGKARSIREGIERGKELVFSGRAFEKLRQWAMVQCDDEERGLRRFAAITAEAGLSV